MKTATFSILINPFRKIRLLILGKKSYNALQSERKAKRKQKYYYIKYTTSALRVLAWVILVLGCIGSLVWGITTGEIEGGLRTVLGIIGSFLVWLALLAARELLKLLMDVKANTRSPGDYITKDIT